MEYILTRPMWTADKTLYREGKRNVTDAHAKELGLAKSAALEPDAGGAGGGIDGVDFASAAARAAAEDAGLTAADFRGKQGSSAEGFTKPDVTALIEARG